MGISIHPVSGAAGQPYTQSLLKVSSPDSTPAITAQLQAATTPLVTAASSTSTTSGSDSQYQAALVQAAISFKNVYAISDQSFSIFKDTTGKYITRYVSLRDGKVTYVPEPTLVKQLQLSGESGSSSRVAINA